MTCLQVGLARVLESCWSDWNSLEPLHRERTGNGSSVCFLVSLLLRGCSLPEPQRFHQEACTHLLPSSGAEHRRTSAHMSYLALSLQDPIVLHRLGLQERQMPGPGFRQKRMLA